MRRLFAACLAALLTACASAPPTPLDPARRGLEASRRELARRAGALPATQEAWLARLDEAFGDRPAAYRRWLGLAERAPELRAWAQQRLLGLVDRTPIAAEDLARVRPIAELAELAEALALRLEDGQALSEARTRLGTSFDWKRSHRLLRYPGSTASPPIAAGLEGGFTSRAGLIASPEEGPGLYAFELALPPGRHRVEVRSEHALRAYAQGRLLLEHEALAALLPERVSFEVALAAGETLQLQLVSRTAVARARVLVHPPEAPAAGPLRGPLAVLARFELALAARDIAGAHAADLGPGPFGALARALLALADPSRAPERARADAKAALASALDEEPGFEEARELLVGLHEDDQELDEVERWRDGRTGRAAPPATELPRSCSARADWLDSGWERLGLDPEAVVSAFSQPLAPLPGPCLEARLRAVSLLREVFALDGAARVLAPLLGDLDPGPERARALDLAGQLALARGDWQAALAHAREAQRIGGEDAFAAELAARAERLLGGAPHARVVPGDVGLPLQASRPLLLAHLRKGGGAPDGRELLLDDRFVRVNADGSLRVRVHRIVRVNDVAAVESVGELPVPDDAEILLVRTWKHQRGRLTPLEPEDILEKATVSLPGLAPGDFAEWAYFYPIAADARLAPGWRAPVYAFDSDEGRVGVARYTLSLAPSAAPPTFVIDPRVAPPKRPDAATWVFEARGLERVFSEPLDPRPELWRMTLSASSGLTHLQLGDARAAELALSTRSTPTLARLYDEAVAALPEHARSEELLAALYAAVQRGIDEPADASPFGVEASWIVERRRGSRALLLTALCRHAGLDCRLVMARPLWEGPETGSPDPERLSYPLVRFDSPGVSPLGSPAGHRSGPVYLDPASRFMPFGLLPPALEGVFGVAHAPRGPERRPPDGPPGTPLVSLIETPAAPADPAHWGERRVSLHIALEPGAKSYLASCEEVLDGVFAASWRGALIGMNADARDKVVAAMAAQALPGASVEAVVIEHLEAEEVPLLVKWRARGSSEAQRGGEERQRKLLVALLPEGLAQGTVMLPAREAPLLVNRAARLRLTLTLDTPDGWAFVSAPSDQLIDYELGRLERTSRFENLGRRVVVDKRFLLRPGVVTPDRYPAWSDAASAIDRADLVELPFAPVPKRAP